MKKILKCLLANFYILLTILFLTACGKQPDHVTAEIDGVNYGAVIDSVEQTITTPDGIVYSYIENASGVSFIYPDGKKCFVGHSESNTVMTGDQNIDAENYLTVEILWELYQQRTTVPGFLFVRILGTVLGGMMVIFPKVFWAFRYGWLFKDAKINPPVLWAVRIIGAVIILWMYLF